MKIKNINELESLNFPEPIKEQIRKAFNEKTTRNRNTYSAPDVEQSTISQQMEAEGHQRFNNPVRIRIVAYRSRETDSISSVSEKAVVDALVKAKVLRNDSRKEIPYEIDFFVVISKEEKTLIIIEEI
jgi:hypothetical protein